MAVPSQLAQSIQDAAQGGWPRMAVPSHLVVAESKQPCPAPLMPGGSLVGAESKPGGSLWKSSPPPKSPPAVQPDPKAKKTYKPPPPGLPPLPTYKKPPPGLPPLILRQQAITIQRPSAPAGEFQNSINDTNTGDSSSTSNDDSRSPSPVPPTRRRKQRHHGMYDGNDFAHMGQVRRPRHGDNDEEMSMGSRDEGPTRKQRRR